VSLGVTSQPCQVDGVGSIISDNASKSAFHPRHPVLSSWLPSSSPIDRLAQVAYQARSYVVYLQPFILRLETVGLPPALPRRIRWTIQQRQYIPLKIQDIWKDGYDDATMSSVAS
jgi:hypothetical protein